MKLLLLLAALSATTTIHAAEVSKQALVRAQMDSIIASVDKRQKVLLSDIAEIKAAIQQVHIGIRDSDVEALSASLAPGFFWLTDTGGIYRPEFVSGGAVSLQEFLTNHERINPAIYDTELVFGRFHPKNGNFQL